jgi:hypothetical protein
MQCTIHRLKIFEGMLALWFDRASPLTTSTKLRTRACPPALAAVAQASQVHRSEGRVPEPPGLLRLS